MGDVTAADEGCPFPNTVHRAPRAVRHGSEDYPAEPSFTARGSLTARQERVRAQAGRSAQHRECLCARGQDDGEVSGPSGSGGPLPSRPLVSVLYEEFPDSSYTLTRNNIHYIHLIHQLVGK